MYAQQKIQQPLQGNLKLHQQHFLQQQAMVQRSFLQVFWVHFANLCSHSFNVPWSFGGEPPASLSVPPKTSVIARTAVEIVIEKAVNIENMVISCSWKRVQILPDNDVSSSRTFAMVFLILVTCVWRSFRFFDSISSLACFWVLKHIVFLCITVFVHQYSQDTFLLLWTFLISLLMCLSVSVSFDVLFKSSPCMLCKTLSMPPSF